MRGHPIINDSFIKMVPYFLHVMGYVTRHVGTHFLGYSHVPEDRIHCIFKLLPKNMSYDKIRVNLERDRCSPVWVVVILVSLSYCCCVGSMYNRPSTRAYRPDPRRRPAYTIWSWTTGWRATWSGGRRARTEWRCRSRPGAMMTMMTAMMIGGYLGCSCCSRHVSTGCYGDRCPLSSGLYRLDIRSGCCGDRAADTGGGCGCTGDAHGCRGDRSRGYLSSVARGRYAACGSPRGYWDGGGCYGYQNHSSDSCSRRSL